MDSQEFKNIAVIGGGSWATALVKIISENHDVQISWWLRNAEDVNYISQFHHNPKYLSAVEIHPDKVTPTSNSLLAISHAEAILLAVPSAFLHHALKGVILPKNKVYISAVKGIDPITKKVIAHYLESEHGIASQKIGLISGPCHAEEVALEKLSYLTLCALDLNLAHKIARTVACRYIVTAVNDDLYGTEYATVLKNIYAIGAGVSHGLGYGDNFLAVYVSAAIREMECFLDALHEKHRDVKNSAYLGDLLVTCYSQFSRNRTFGNMLGKGYSVKTAQLEMNMVAEGYYATESVYLVNQQLQASMPILDSIYSIIYKNESAARVLKELAMKLY